DSIWQTSFLPIGSFNPYEFGGISYLDKVVFSDGRSFYVIDAETGQILWFHRNENARGYACVIDDYLYKVIEDTRDWSSLFRYDLNTGFEEKLFTINRSEYGNNYSPGLLMPIQWVHPNGNKILVLQNRTYGWYTDGTSKMDILAWNLTADSMLWYRESLDGFSSTARPAIDGDKVYFYGDHHAYCINPLNGETIWKYFIGDGPEDDFNTANILIVDDKLIVKPDNEHIHAVDKETGENIWTNENTEAMPYKLTVHKDTIWFCSAGIFGIDANTGEKLIDDWNNGGNGSWIFPVAHHPINGNIYTSDASYIYCLNPKFMK
ncbi:MAG: PQQ-binding-like beta-propeller repeat protein, partial [Bacteroidia bacterium]|nr:PQQ-binding-like beta-propeller repeat protein [Bacteroidia bacterium]